MGEHIAEHIAVLPEDRRHWCAACRATRDCRLADRTHAWVCGTCGHPLGQPAIGLRARHTENPKPIRHDALY